ncbi:MAG: pyridoxamine 5'-phosphate oxidase family protein [Burkholderiales bacterium]|nr:pyridoxamine 5'-phosphate oxidase family protein [Burkholderiales bacterium]
MQDPRIELLRTLLSRQVVGALGTLHAGKPAVSMVPFACEPLSKALVIHVSRLATHTRDMETSPWVSLMVMADRDPAVPPQALARITVAGRAEPCPADAAAFEQARGAYLARFPDSEPMFGFADFSLFLVQPESVRVVGGFGRAGSITRAQYLQAMTAMP